MFRQRLLNYVTIHASKAIFAFHTYGNSLLRHFPRKLMPAFSEELKEPSTLRRRYMTNSYDTSVQPFHIMEDSFDAKQE